MILKRNKIVIALKIIIWIETLTIVKINKAAKPDIWIQSNCIKQNFSFTAAKINSKIYPNIKLQFKMATLVINYLEIYSIKNTQFIFGD